jgi:hypothetical protein
MVRGKRFEINKTISTWTGIEINGGGLYVNPCAEGTIVDTTNQSSSQYAKRFLRTQSLKM